MRANGVPLETYLNLARGFIYIHMKFMHQFRLGIESAVVGIAEGILGNGKQPKTRMSHKTYPRISFSGYNFLRHNRYRKGNPNVINYRAENKISLHYSSTPLSSLWIPLRERRETSTVSCRFANITRYLPRSFARRIKNWPGERYVIDASQSFSVTRCRMGKMRNVSCG